MSIRGVGIPKSLIVEAPGDLVCYSGITRRFDVMFYRVKVNGLIERKKSKN